MEVLMYLAALLIMCVAFAHSYLGERYILVRLFKRSEMPHLFGGPQFTINTLRFAWHLTSVAWVGFAAIIVALSVPELDRWVLAKIIIATFGVHGIVALLASKGKHLSWVFFLLISILVCLGFPK
tara:strand:+ start:909 stop:1283 length:375 start_codon:yes stop_codon:yes gene_type:complete